MCGGRGTRLNAPVEKPLYRVCGRPMVDAVLDALVASAVETTYAAVSPHAQATREHVAARPDCAVVETPGEGYVADLDAALSDERLGRPVVTCVADLPLLVPDHVDDAVATVDGDGSVTVTVPAALKRLLGVNVDTTLDHEGRELAPTGLNVVGRGDDTVSVSHDVRLAVNVNHETDAAVAERLCQRT